ncbi:MAG: monovalent cation/H(+) antiporter subunit G [Lachnospiraceae bacterium]|nr:monovalent cation/H(+) antiporter subunit G [Lachnospiraceae bacterium]
MMEWIRFWMTAVLLLIGAASFASAVLGAWRFGFSMNRMHAAGIGDTMAILFVVAALFVSSANVMDALKLLFLIFFLWFTSPVSTHFLGQVEYYNNRELGKYVRRMEKTEEKPETEDKQEVEE